MKHKKYVKKFTLFRTGQNRPTEKCMNIFLLVFEHIKYKSCIWPKNNSAISIHIILFPSDTKIKKKSGFEQLLVLNAKH